jgi:tetratricopeptide (TPR) repeat protein
MRQRTSFALALLLAVPFAVPAQTPPITESMGIYRTSEQKAIEAYSRGLKAKRKAEAEKDPAKQTKLYQKAKEELSRSAGYHPNYDAYLALGQVYLALGMKESALSSCGFAQSLKPKDEAAKSCIEQAQEETQDAAATKPAGG